ncbi:MAG: chemotaxis protein CheW [Synergistales bacterium]
MSRVVVLKLDQERYGIPIEVVREILPFAEITPVPGSPDFFAGFMNVRGELVAVTSLRRFIGKADPAEARSSKILVVSSESGVVQGLIADDVTSIEDVPLDSLQPVEDGANRYGFPKGFVRGVAVAADRLVVVLDVERLLLEARQEEQGQRVS